MSSVEVFTDERGRRYEVRAGQEACMPLSCRSTLSGAPQAPLCIPSPTQLMLTLVVKLMQLPDDGGQLRAFLAAQQEAASIPFISWVADQEAAATGPQKQVGGNGSMQLRLAGMSKHCWQVCMWGRSQRAASGQQWAVGEPLQATVDTRPEPKACIL